MDVRKIAVVVEDVEVARTALEWALRNLLRYGDLITLLHVFSPTKSRSSKKMRLLRLKGFQLALSFKDICNSFFNINSENCVAQTNVEIIVTEGDQEGGKIAALVREIGASALVVGLHDQSFLYKLAMGHINIANNLNCRILAIRQPAQAVPPLRSRSSRTSLSSATPTPDCSVSMDFSQIHISPLEFPEISPPKVSYKICPDPYAIIWRWRRKSRMKEKS